MRLLALLPVKITEGNPNEMRTNERKNCCIRIYSEEQPRLMNKSNFLGQSQDPKIGQELCQNFPDRKLSLRPIRALPPNKERLNFQKSEPLVGTSTRQPSQTRYRGRSQ